MLQEPNVNGSGMQNSVVGGGCPASVSPGRFVEAMRNELEAAELSAVFSSAWLLGETQLWDSKGQWPHVASEAGRRQNYAMCSNARAQGGALTPSALRPP